ncbi:MAG TPA: hypothetical protein DDW30_08125 [Clostridiales bacterium]|nr:hypothetical protein [Clostridiales bacterium]
MSRYLKKPQEEGPTKPEGFAGRNVKVITFAVCMVVFFAFFGPLSFFRIRDCAEKKNAEKLPELTVDDVIAFCEDNRLLTMSRLRRYRGVYKAADKGNTFTAEFSHYILLAFEDPATGKMTFCEVTDLQTEDRLDLLGEKPDPTGFFGRK